jgi:hypothetical protein
VGSSTSGVSEPPAEVRSDDSSVRPAGSRRRLVWRLLAVLAALLVIWAAVAAALLVSARGSLRDAEQALPEVRAAVADADLPAAEAALEAAHDDLTSADRAMRSPFVVPLRWAPVVGTDVRAVAAIARGGAGITTASMDTMASVQSLPGGLDALAPADGALPVGAMEELAPSLREVAAATAEALARITDTPGSGRVAEVTDARERILEVLAPIAEVTDTGAQLAAVMPTFLGSDRPRIYLFGASTPAELRGTGGFIGSVAEVTIDRGLPSFGTFVATSELPVLDPDVLAPPVAEDARRWSRYGGTGSWQALSYSPHFPAAASAMEDLWAETQGERVDGMIVADPFALAVLLELSGPADVPDYGPLDAASVVDYVTNEAYADYDDATERKEVLGLVAATAFERFLSQGSEAASSADMLRQLARLVRDGHLLVHSADDDVQGAFALVGATGELGDPDGDLVNVVLNSGSASKIDYYAERRIDLDVTLRADGSASSELEVAVTNTAPVADQPRYVIGPNNPLLEAGDSFVSISVYLARGASFQQTPSASDGLPASLDTELGHPVHDGWVRIPSGDTVERRYRWQTPEAWRLEGDEVVYELLFQGQTVIRPTQVTLRIGVPDGFEPVDLPDGAELVDGAVVWSGSVRGEDVALPLRLRAAS